MQRERLTPERIRRFKNPEGVKQDFLWDTEAPRLAVRATAGAKSFIFESKLSRRTVRVTIGDVRAWNLDDARAEARRLQTQIDQGIDPRQERAERIAAAEAKREEARRVEAPALEAWGAYVEARKAKWSAHHLADHQNVAKVGGEKRTRGRRKGEPDTTQPGALRSLLGLPLSQIDADRVRAWLQDESAKRPTHARLAFGLLRAFLNWCVDRPEYRTQIQADACASRLARDELPKKASKNDCLQREQLRLWFGHVRALPSPVQSAYLQVLLLTGARREELAGLRWEDVDFQWKSLRIRDKVDGERTIPLTPYVAALLRDLDRRNETPPPEWRILDGKRIRNDLESWRPSEWVFSSRTAASGRIQEPRIAHNKAIAAAGLPSLTLHGLRRSFGTLAEWVECPAGISAQIMGHKPSAIAEKHYRRRPLDLLRQWHTTIEAWILAEAGIDQPGSDVAGPALQAVA
ncbi:tyrosine-type recombinase/integrase [Aromatoleum diolicum]|uniref:Tyrosine-type recombinase/integrase n=1 Tax=Aromatoleum diolicum TaxID=75796 RepID=A0ABX1Q6T4_9RHOO|nr:integrase family protein [Aromatoleum diolicum]NMG73708.1 tyrosine-type recombinase/integrase [Aromatoleum diolicum]